ncbi:MAG: metallophosphoesterase family protein [Paludibacter sp.]
MTFKYHLFVAFIITFASSTLNAQFHFALITDLHIQLNDNKSTIDLQNTISDINKMTDIDFVIVAGDVTENGDSASLVKAKNILKTLKMPYYITFGNHDMISSNPNMRIYKPIFGSDKFSFTHKNVQFIGFTTGPVLNRGIGHVNSEDLIWIDAELNKIGKSIPIIAITHYPMQSGDVDNWYDLTDILRKYNVQALINGHYHRNAILNYDGIAGIVCRSTLSKNELMGGYTIFNVSDSIQVSEKIVNDTPREWLAFPIEQKTYDLPNKSLRK